MKIAKILCLLGLCGGQLLGDFEEVFDQGSDPSLVNQVNVITGHLELSFQDTVVEGAEPLSLTRSYSSAGALRDNREQEDLIRRSRTGWVLEGGWNLMPHIGFYREYDEKNLQEVFYVFEPHGRRIKFMRSKDKKGEYLAHVDPDRAATCSMSGLQDIRNYRLIVHRKKGEAYLKLPNGGERYYKGKPLKDAHKGKGFTCWFLQREYLPTKRKVVYHYQENERLCKVETRSLDDKQVYATAEFNIKKSYPPCHLEITTSDGKVLEFKESKPDKHGVLEKVTSNFKAEENYVYTPRLNGHLEFKNGVLHNTSKWHFYNFSRLTSFSVGGLQQLEIEYATASDKDIKDYLQKGEENKPCKDLDKVKALYAPLGENGEKVCFATYKYYKKCTDVRDSHGILTRYRHDEKNIQLIEYYNDKEELIACVGFQWADGRLKSKGLMDLKGQNSFSKVFSYDGYGNMIKEVLYGPITQPFFALSHILPDGSIEGGETCTKTYTYDHLHRLLTESREGGLSYRYQYFDEYEPIKAKYTLFLDKIISREFYDYDGNGFLIHQTEDNGSSENPESYESVTRKKFKKYKINPSNGLVDKITEGYVDLLSMKEVSLRTTEKTYCPNLQVCSENIFDAEGRLCYGVTKTYDKAGRLISSISPMGKGEFWNYDDMGRLVYHKQPGRDSIVYQYDKAGRMIASMSSGKEDLYRYDKKSCLIEHVNHQGHQVLNTYDHHHRLTNIVFPSFMAEGELFTPQFHFDYDAAGNLLSTKDSDGIGTKTSYNFFKKPVSLIDKNGDETKHFYRKNGTLYRSIYPDGTQIDYQHDFLERLIEKKIYFEKKCLQTESWAYDAFHLLSYKNPQGITTFYFYDGMGQLIKERCLDREILYEYDNWGREVCVRKNGLSSYKNYDWDNQIIETYESDESGAIKNRTLYEYDQEGRKIRATRFSKEGEGVDHFTYDAKGRLLEHKEPYGFTTSFIYDEGWLNEYGQKVEKKIIIDPLGLRTVEIKDPSGHLVSKEKQDTKGQTVGKEVFVYNKQGLKVEHITSIYTQGQPKSSFSVRWDYDLMGRVIKETQQDELFTSFVYDKKGHLIQKILPSSISIHYLYDALDRMVGVKSSDGQIDHLYEYGLWDQPIKIKDRISQYEIKREYNLFGELISESNSNGFHFSWDYDQQGRCRLFHMKGYGFIESSYEGLYLRKVSRLNEEQTLLYAHSYDEFDPNGHVCQETALGNIGQIQTKYDKLERASYQYSPYFEHYVSYGPSGLMNASHHNLTETKHFLYDSLNQLMKEGNLNYSFDSLGNPSDAHVNDLNQLIDYKTSHMLYDLNGHLTRKIDGDHTFEYTYDPLGRLVSLVEDGKRKILFSYDPLSRLIGKKEIQIGSTPLQKEIFYLYDQDIEIGSVDEKKNLLDLKVVGLSVLGDIGGSVALEIKGRVYFPVHDFQGHVVALLDEQGVVVDRYLRNAFGVENPSLKLSPWRFSSKRGEENLFFFGHRFYDPHLGRWLTPDPDGFNDGMNLYAYVHNDPINRLDLFGLSATQLNLTFDHLSFAPLIPLSGYECSFMNWSRSFFNESEEQRNKSLLKGIGADIFIFSRNSVGDLDYSCLDTKNVPPYFKNLFSHLPKEKPIVAATVLMSGINTSYWDHMGMIESLGNRLPVQHPIIGLADRSTGVKKDLLKIGQDNMASKETSAISKMRQVLVSLSENIDRVNPKAMAHIVLHSKGAYNFTQCLDGMTPEQKEKVKNQFVVTGLGGLSSIKKEQITSSKNVWNSGDFVTRRWGDMAKVNGEIFPSVKGSPIVDHSYFGSSYQEVLDREVNALMDKYPFYQKKKR
ncbi:MAG: RHS repeat-associated core domain-containing protein [Rhabdochlamydiaceae bacterium]